MRRVLAKLRHAVRRIKAAGRPRRFFSAAEQHRIVAAIQRAERETSGEIRVHVEERCPGDAYARAREVFAALGMYRTQQRNGTLIYLAVGDRKFAVIGDEGIHAVVPPGFWDTVRDAMATHFRAGSFVVGVCAGVAAIGEQLQAYFPWTLADQAELTDEVSEGETGPPQP